MEEKRRSKRTKLHSESVMKHLGGSVEEVKVNVLDISKDGVGFKSKDTLEVGEIYECHLTIWTKEIIHTCIKVVRSLVKDGEYFYGARFIGMYMLDAYRIEAYQAVYDHD